MRIRLSPELREDLQEIARKNPKLAKLIEKQLDLFIKDPRHKSLRVHKLSGKLQNMWSISITRDMRMVYLQDGDEAHFFDIGTHDEVYKK